MLFNSYIFIFIFLPITLFGYFFINHFGLHKLSKFWLVIASFAFYGYFNISYLWIIITSILFNFCVNKLFGTKWFRERKKVKALLFIFALLANIGILIFYKYLDFIFECSNKLFSTDFVYMDLLLPLGISFFTFQQLSYLVDSYKDKVPSYNILDYSLFVTFFPQLIAGPIVLHSEVIPQFENKENLVFNSDNFAKGLYAFSAGLAKKVIIADTFGKIVTYGYSNISSLTSLEGILTIFAYTFQIYFDFSGYCDMASGIALMFNIELPINFNSPYKAKNISEFWKRWHITLTRFLTNYVYFPLGGSRCSKHRTCINILIVFFVSGLWHGAGLTFILWGLMHGIAMVIYRLCKKYIDKIPTAIIWTINFLFIALTWVYFRADSIEDANNMIMSVFNGGFSIGMELSETLFNVIPISIITNLISINNILYPLMVGIVMLFVIICIKTKNVQEKIREFMPTIKKLISTYIMLVYSILSLSGVSTFLYFNF